MEPANGQRLDRETIQSCVKVLRSCLQSNPHTNEKDKFEVNKLISWLLHVDLQCDSDEDDLDDAAKAYLMNYRETFTRKRLNPKGLGGVVGDSPRVYHSPSFINGSLIDEASELGQQLDKLDEWDDFDIFKMERLTTGRPLETVGMACFERFDLIEKLKIPQAKMRSFLQSVEKAYNKNPYHNSMHAADVMQALSCMFIQDDFTAQLTELELFAMLVAACVHDVGHPGLTNEFLINSNSEMALMYNDNSVNENMHIALAFRILRRRENNILEHLPDEQYRFVRRTIVKIVLSTDMANHTDVLKDFVTNVKLLGTDLTSWGVEKRVSVLRMVVHCADISNPAKPLHLSTHWAKRVMLEFFAQGDKERESGMAVSPLCDRQRVVVPKSQMTFLDYVVRPSLEALAELAPHTAAQALRHVAAARQHYDSLMEKGVLTAARFFENGLPTVEESDEQEEA